jgi:hypothetical protein
LKHKPNKPDKSRTPSTKKTKETKNPKRNTKMSSANLMKSTIFSKMLLKEQVFTVKSTKSLLKYWPILKVLLQPEKFKLNNYKTASKRVDSELARTSHPCIQTNLYNKT